MKKKLPFFLVLILLLEISISVESQTPVLLKYVLQWPPTFCIDLHSKGEGRCKEPIPVHKFTLHGLMQANEGGFSITCIPGEDPDWDKVFRPIKDKLLTFWPSLRVDFNETEFWKREWHKHGTCGGETAKKYFHTAIKINDKPKLGNLFNYLEVSGIIPSDSLAYPKEAIVEAIQKVFYESPPPPTPPLNIYLSCIPINPENATHVYLSEVTLCTNLDGTEYISCPIEADPASCPDEALIMLPLPKPQQEQTDLPSDIWKTLVGRILGYSRAEMKAWR